MTNPDLLDWSLDNAPDPDEPPPAVQPAPPPGPRPGAALSRLPRRAWLLLGVPVVLALLFAVVYPRLEARRAQTAIEQVIATQEQARLAGDWATLQSSYVRDSAGWSADQVSHLKTGVLPVPILLPGARPEHQAGRLGQFQLLSRQLARADVIRAYTLADGTQASFALPQFYQFGAGAWRQVAPPEIAAGSARVLHGSRVDIAYYPDDAELAASLAHDLDTLLARACADWGCSPDLRLSVSFDASDRPPPGNPLPLDLLPDSLTFQSVLAYQSLHNWRKISLPTRQVGGYPVDAAAAEAVRRAAGIQALLGTAQWLAPRMHYLGGDVFVDALVVREAVRLELEPARLAEIQIANPLFDLNTIWLLEATDSSTGEPLHQALAMLNQVLVGQSTADEGALLQVLRFGARDAPAWLAAGLGLTPAEAEARLTAALDSRFPTVRPPGFATDLALSCPAGPLLATLSGQMAPLLAGEYAGSFVLSWSPDGQRLALTVSGRLGVVTLNGASGQFAPQPIAPWLVQATWASNTAVVYTPTHASRRVDQIPPGLAFDDLGLNFFDAADPGRALDPIRGYRSYVPSPNLEQAALAGSDVTVIPAFDLNRGKWIGGGHNPLWSPDGRYLVFVNSDSANLWLHLFDTSSGAKRTLLTAGAGALAGDENAGAGVPLIPSDTSFVDALPAWAPAGDRVALVVNLSLHNQAEGWVGIVGLNGAGFQLLPLDSSQGTPVSVGFSADGRYLAVGLSNSAAPSVAIYLSADGSLLRLVPGVALAGWSPSGHTLALSGADGVSLLREPGDSNLQPEPFGPAECSGAAWRPK